MFEDIYKGRNLKEEIREHVQNQIQKGIEQSINRGNDKWIVDIVASQMNDKLDEVIGMYFGFFTSDEIIAVMDWNKSDLGIRLQQFNDEIMTPFISDFFNTAMEKMFTMHFEEPVGEA